MKKRRSLLDEMRADVARREAELAKPLREQVARSQQIASTEAQRRQNAERALASRFLPDISHRTANLFERKVEEEITRACHVALRGAEPGADLTIKLPFHVAAYADPRSVVNRALERWRMEALPRADFDSFLDTHQRSTTIQIRVPEMTFRHDVNE